MRTAATRSRRRQGAADVRRPLPDSCLVPSLLAKSRPHERFGKKPSSRIDEPLARLGKVPAGKLRLDPAVIHHVADPQADARVKEGLASAIDFAPEEVGDGFIYRHGFPPRE